MQRQRQGRGEEEAHREHVRRIVVKVQVLVAGVRHPIEMADNAVRETKSPGAQQDRTNHDQREVGEDRHAEGERHVIADAELAADLDFAQRPRHEGAQRANGDELPQAAFLQRRQGEPIADVGRRDIDLPWVPGRPKCRPPGNQRDSDERKEDRRDPEETDIKRPGPEIEQVAADQRPAANAVFPFKAQHRHDRSPRMSGCIARSPYGNRDAG